MKHLFIPLLTLPLIAEEPKTSDDVLASLQLPGIKVNVDERAIDVTASVCLDEGSLEFIACTKNTKEHESIVSVNAKPSHIHTALLLLGVKPGHPAIRKVVGEEGNERWIDLPPKGSPIAVSLVITSNEGKTKEHPISHFVSRIDYDADPTEPEAKEAGERLKTFLFAGSHLHDGQEGQPKIYLADNSGSVISLSTFGDELLCLPEVYGNENHALQWALNPRHLPKVGTKVVLRLRPKEKPKAGRK